MIWEPLSNNKYYVSEKGYILDTENGRILTEKEAKEVRTAEALISLFADAIWKNVLKEE